MSRVPSTQGKWGMTGGLPLQGLPMDGPEGNNGIHPAREDTFR